MLPRPARLFQKYAICNTQDAICRLSPSLSHASHHQTPPPPPGYIQATSRLHPQATHTPTAYSSPTMSKPETQGPKQGAPPSKGPSLASDSKEDIPPHVLSANPDPSLSANTAVAPTRQLLGPRPWKQPGFNRETQKIIDKVYNFMLVHDGAQNLILLDIPPQMATLIIWFFSHFDHPVWCLLIERVDRFRYQYNLDTNTLFVLGKPTYAHLRIVQFFQGLTFRNQLIASSVFSDAEIEAIDVCISDVFLPRGSRKRQSNGDLKESSQLGARFKLPLLALQLKSHAFPHVIFEVGHFHKDAPPMEANFLPNLNEWLVSTKGRVRMVVLVKIEEGDVPGKSWGQLEGDDEWELDDGDGDPGYESSASAPDFEWDLEKFMKAMANMKYEVNDWVGKLTVFMECWGYASQDDKIELLFPRQYLIRDNELCNPMPTLQLSRSLFNLESHPSPSDSSSSSPSPPKPNSVDIDLTECATAILGSRVSDAFNRKHQCLVYKRMRRSDS